MKARMSNPAPALGRTHRASAGSDIQLVGAETVRGQRLLHLRGDTPPGLTPAARA
jgi:hypothetical protein